ncbi:hypothetical protein A1D23_06045 [Chelonobacter oris]|uniref:hypothetical protein n=1 Tax=Chelonobacter oris TaxID=505317 RepID=UPI00244B7029|nr:hypothetical protein [Chelonobacter oris]MDH2999654.1 hypothetical protein [Chelonobacter oris]
MYIFSQNHVTRAKLTRSEYANIHPDFKGKINGKPSILHSGSQIIFADILTQKNALEQITKLYSAGFVSSLQYGAIKNLLKSNEKAFFIESVDRIYSTIEVMPKTYEQDGKGDKAIAYLHYFTSNGDFYITEKDIDNGVTQAFGLASIGDCYPEIGYISIAELVKMGLKLIYILSLKH